MIKTCLVCHQPLKLFCQKGDSKIYRCVSCGLGVTDQLKPQMGEYHRDDTYIKEETLFKNIFQKRVNIISRFKRGGRVLEVGCSTGLMLSLLKKRGFSVLGVEISPVAAQAAKERGIKVIVQPFEQVKFSNKFDVVIFNHTLEHLPDPLAVIKKAANILKKDGCLFIDLPNFGSLSARIYRCSWPLLLPDEHYYHFTLESLSKLLKVAGLGIIFNERASGIWDFAHPYLELWQALTHFKKRFFINALTAVPTFFVTKLGWGSGLTVVAFKK